MKRSGPLRRGTPLQRRTRLATISRKTRSRIMERTAVRREVLARDGGCVARWLVVDVACSGRIDVHEVRTRARFPGSQYRPEDCVALCRAHHEWTHDHGQQAERLGLLAPSHR